MLEKNGTPRHDNVMTEPLTLACLQTRPMSDFATALAEALELARIAVAKGANFLALPEYCGGLKMVNAAIAAPCAPEVSHPVLRGLQGFARENNVWVLAGSVAVPGQNGKIANRSCLIDDQGRIVARYDKIHLFDIQLSAQEVYRESDTVTPGNRCVVVQTPFGKVGMSICYDLRFAGLYRDMAQAGAEILFVPAAFTQKTGAAHWHVLNRARAIENGAFVVAVDALGDIEGGGSSYGHSLIISPWGEVLADAGDKRGVVVAELDMAQAADTRARIPNLMHDRAYQVC